MQLYNLHWVASFGHELGLTPAESLGLLMNPENIPPEMFASICSAPGEWSPSVVMDNFIKNGFIQMMDDINKIMDEC